MPPAHLLSERLVAVLARTLAALMPTEPEPRGLLALMLLQLRRAGRDDEAGTSYDRALVLAPGDSKRRYLQARIELLDT